MRKLFILIHRDMEVSPTWETPRGENYSEVLGCASAERAGLVGIMFTGNSFITTNAGNSVTLTAPSIRSATSTASVSLRINRET